VEAVRTLLEKSADMVRALEQMKAGTKHGKYTNMKLV
jgi:hypothetical protein